MSPTLEPGDRLLAAAGVSIRENDIVALTDPRQPDRTLVKRVAALLADGRIDVRGDRADHSTDSRDFGPVERRHLLGRVLWRYAPPDRIGRP